MAIVYFDSSAFVKLVIDEVGSDLAAALWDGCDAAVSSRLAYPEVCAALAAARRARRLDADGHARAAALWDDYWAGVRAIGLTAPVAAAAGRLAHVHGLRGADAVHLASAGVLGAADTVFAVWDRRLHAGAAEVGMRLAPRTLADI